MTILKRGKHGKKIKIVIREGNNLGRLRLQQFPDLITATSGTWGDEGEGTLHTTSINEKEQQQTLAGASYNQSMCCFTGCELVSKLPVEVYSPLRLHFLIQPFFI